MDDSTYEGNDLLQEEENTMRRKSLSHQKTAINESLM